MKKTGMKLSEIKNFSDLKQEGVSTQNERLEMLAQQRAKLLQKCAELKQSLGFLEDTIELTKNC